jgi:hypothetical protein
MAAGKELCSACEKPFYGKQKTIRYGVCDLRFHCSCVQICDSDQVFLNSSGKSTFKCAACIKLLKTNRNDDTPVKPQRSMSASEATKKVMSPERQLNLPEITSNE